jgi:hypothetical protein
MRLVAASAFLGPAGCSAKQAEHTSTVEPESSISLTGRIDAASLQTVKQKLSPRTERLIVNSAGGRIPEAIELGALIRSLGVEVVVDGLCLSACAHFVFVPAKRKRVEPKSVVAFHHTATALSQLLIASGRQDLAAVYLPVAKQEQDFYIAAGISRNLLDGPFRELMPLCYKEQEEAPSASEYRTALFSQFSFYVPALADLHRQGVGPIEGYWPTSPNDIEQAAARYPRQLNLSFKMKLTTSGRDLPHQAVALPACPDHPRYQLPVRDRPKS